MRDGPGALDSRPAMKKTKKTFAEKLQNDHGLPKVVPIPPRNHKQWGVGTIVIAAPREVDALMKKVGKGKVTTMAELGRALEQRLFVADHELRLVRPVAE